ncbi:MAG: ankyrin repeat domain-containing protein [Gammaproteobacteria bacterium]|nr:ankyrin repeat domain-containing protein [Gammaproteobacteria bacterium]
MNPFNRMQNVLVVLIVSVMTACAGDTYSELQLAAARGQTDRVAVMLDKGADVNDYNKHGRTALMMASASGHNDTVALLLKRNAFINAQDVDGMTPLIEAAASGHDKTITLLLENDADINITNKYGATALTNAVFFSHVDAVKALLSAKTRLSEETTENAFLIAAGLGNLQMLTDLLDYGVNINSRGKKGRTALMAATTFEHEDAVQLLISKGADLSIRDIEGQTALEIAKENDLKNIVAQLSSVRKK